MGNLINRDSRIAEQRGDENIRGHTAFADKE